MEKTMGTKLKKRIACYVTAVAMLFSVFSVPALGYAEEKDQGFTIYSYDNDTGSMSELTGEWHVYLQATQSAGAPWGYFCVRPSDEEAAVEFTAEWTSSNPSVAECIEQEESDIIQVMYNAMGTTTISAIVDGNVVSSFKIKITDEYKAKLPITNIGFYMDGENKYGTIESYAWDDSKGYYADYLLPFEYDSEKGVFIIVNSADGYETKYSAKVVNGRAEIKFKAYINDVKQNFTIYFKERTASNNVGCDIHIIAKNNAGDEKYIETTSEEAKNGPAKIIIPYGYDYDARLYVKAHHEGATIDNYEGYYSETTGEFIGEKVSGGQVKTFTVVAADGTKQNYSLEFFVLDGKSVDIDLTVYCDDANTKDFAENGWSMKTPEFTDVDGIRVANIQLPYKYDNKKGFDLFYTLADTANCDLSSGPYYLDENGNKKLEFTVTSGDGLLSQKYALNVSKDTKGTSTDLVYFKISYTDKNGNRVTKNLSAKKAATKNGILYELPGGTKNTVRSVRIEAKTVENAYIIKADRNAADDEFRYWMETLDFEFNIGNGEDSPTKPWLTFVVRSSNGKNKQTYTVKVKAHEHKYKKTVVKPTYTEKGYTKSTCSKCGDVKKSNYTAKKVYKAAPKNVNADLSTEIDGYDNVKISWTKVSGATGYKLYYKKGSVKKWAGLDTVKGKTSYTTEDLAAGAKYTFKVVPYIKKNNKVANSTKYKTASVYTLKKMAAPKVAKNKTKVKVSWSTINGATGYQISQSIDENEFTVAGTYKTTKDKSKTIKAAKGKKYYYAVRAYKTVKVSGKNVKVYGPWSKVKVYTRK